jgi:hypothetical protein
MSAVLQAHDLEPLVAAAATGDADAFARLVRAPDAPKFGTFDPRLDPIGQKLPRAQDVQSDQGIRDQRN